MQRLLHRGRSKPTKADRPDSPGLGDRTFDRRKLLQRGDAGLVHHHVLAAPHRRDRKLGAIARPRRDDHEIDRGIIQQPRGFRRRHMREPLAEPGEHALVRGVRIVADTLGAFVEQVLRQVVDVAMIQPDSREPRHARSSCKAAAEACTIFPAPQPRSTMQAANRTEGE